MITDIIFVVIAYFLGAVPTGVLVAKLLAPNTNLQKEGSGNIGATNVARLLGKKAGALTLAGDLLKGLIAVFLANKFASSDTAVALSMLAVVLGHCYSIFLGFTGGKGVATTFGAYLAITPLVAIVAIAVDVLVIYFTKISAIGSLTAMLILFVVFSFSGFPGIYLLITVLIVAVVFFRHKKNIKELKDSWKS